MFDKITVKLVLITVLSFGFNLIIDKLGVDPRWKYFLWGVIALNEIRGALFVYQFGGEAISSVESLFV